MQQSVYVRRIIRLGECANCGDCCILFDGQQMRRCMWYDLKSEKHCTIYENRPQACRDFPQTPDEIDDKPLCGYYFVDEKGRKVDGNMDKRTHLRFLRLIQIHNQQRKR